MSQLCPREKQKSENTTSSASILVEEEQHCGWRLVDQKK